MLVEHFINDKSEQAEPTVGSVTPLQVVLGGIRKQAQSKPVSSILLPFSAPGPALNSCPDFQGL